MPRYPKMENTRQSNIRLDLALSDRLDAIAIRMSKPGKILHRFDVIRLALPIGADELERKLLPKNQ